MAEAINAATINRLMSKRQSIFSIQYFIFQGQGSQGLTGLATAPSEHRDGQLTSESPFESLRAAEARNSATINQLKYRSRLCITENIALGAWSRTNNRLRHVHRGPGGTTRFT